MVMVMKEHLNNSMNNKQIHFYTYGDSKNIKFQKSIYYLAKLFAI